MRESSKNKKGTHSQEAGITVARIGRGLSLVYNDFTRWYEWGDFGKSLTHYIFTRISYRVLVDVSQVKDAQQTKIPHRIVPVSAEGSSESTPFLVDSVESVTQTLHSIQASINIDPEDEMVGPAITAENPVIDPEDEMVGPAITAENPAKVAAVAKLLGKVYETPVATIGSGGYRDRQKHVWLSGGAFPLSDAGARSRSLSKVLESGFGLYKTSANVLLPAAFYAVLATDFALYLIYPEDRYGNTPLKIFAGISPNQKTLTSYYLNGHASLWLFPAVSLGYAAARGTWDLLSKQCRDLCCLPSSASFYDMRVLKTQLLWDGNAANQQERLEKLIKRAERGNLVEKLYALSCLAGVVNGRRLSDLAKVRRLKRDDAAGLEQLESLETVRTQVLQVLTRYSKFSVAFGREVVSSFLPSIYAKYLLWSLGEGRNLRLDPAFWAVSAGRDLLTWYAKGRLLWGMGNFIYQNVIQEPLVAHSCEQEGKAWVYVKEQADYACTLCGDWRDIYYGNIFAAQTCLDAILAKPRSAAEVLTLVRRVAPLNFTRLDLSRQNWTAWDHGVWWEILDSIARAKTANRGHLEELNLSCPSCDSANITRLSVPMHHAGIIANVLHRIPISRLNLSGQTICANASAIIFINPHMLRAPSLIEVDVSRNPLIHEALPAILRGLPNITQTLILQDSGLTDADMLAVIPFLRRSDLLVLDLSHNFLKSPSEFAAAFPASLQELNLSGNNFTAANLTQFAAYLARSSLRELVLEDVGLGDDNFPLLAASLPAPLQVLDVAGNGIGDEGIQALADNFNTTNLTSLSLSRNLLTLDGAGVLGEALSLTFITDLDLSLTACDRESLRLLANGMPRTLQSLNLAGNDLDSTSGNYIATIILRTNVSKLLLSDNNLGDRGLLAIGGALAVVPSNRSFELSLAENFISAKGMELFSTNATIRTLRVLDFSLNNLGITPRMLASLLKGSSITQLSLAGCGMDEDSSRAVLDIVPTVKYLQKLDVSKNLVDDYAVVQLAGRLITPIPHADQLGNPSLSRDQLRALSDARSATSLHTVGLGATNTTTAGARALCRVMYASVQRPEVFQLQDNPIDQQLVDLNTCVVSASSRLLPFGHQIFSTFGQRETWHRTKLQYFCSHSPHMVENHTSENYSILRVCLDALPADYSKPMLHCTLAIGLALRQEIGARFMGYLPELLQSAISAQLQGPGGELLNIASELWVRAQVSGAASLAYDLTVVTKAACQKQAAESKKEKSVKAEGAKDDSYWSAITGSVVTSLVTLGGIYGLARAATAATGSAIVGALVPSIAFNAKKISTSITNAYKTSGLFAALDAGLDAVVFSLPGGSLIESSLQQQDAALARRVGLFNGASLPKLPRDASSGAHVSLQTTASNI